MPTNLTQQASLGNEKCGTVYQDPVLADLDSHRPPLQHEPRDVRIAAARV